MRCPSCSHELVIRTDPKNTGYEYVEGIRKKEMAFDPEEAETARVQDSEVSEKLAGEDVGRGIDLLFEVGGRGWEGGAFSTDGGWGGFGCRNVSSFERC